MEAASAAKSLLSVASLYSRLSRSFPRKPRKTGCQNREATFPLISVRTWGFQIRAKIEGPKKSDWKFPITDMWKYINFHMSEIRNCQIQSLDFYHFPDICLVNGVPRRTFDFSSEIIRRIRIQFESWDNFVFENGGPLENLSISKLEFGPNDFRGPQHSKQSEKEKDCLKWILRIWNSNFPNSLSKSIILPWPSDLSTSDPNLTVFLLTGGTTFWSHHWVSLPEKPFSKKSTDGGGGFSTLKKDVTHKSYVQPGLLSSSFPSSSSCPSPPPPAPPPIPRSSQKKRHLPLEEKKTFGHLNPQKKNMCQSSKSLKSRITRPQ